MWKWITRTGFGNWNLFPASNFSYGFVIMTGQPQLVCYRREACILVLFASIVIPMKKQLYTFRVIVLWPRKCGMNLGSFTILWIYLFPTYQSGCKSNCRNSSSQVKRLEWGSIFSSTIWFLWRNRKSIVFNDSPIIIDVLNLALMQAKEISQACKMKRRKEYQK